MAALYLRPDSQRTLDKVLRAAPDLCAYGLVDKHLRKRLGIPDYGQDVDPEHFEICCAWLARKTLIQSINTKIGSSYGLKHRVEEWSGCYVTNGEFIAAVIYLRIPFKQYPHIHVALSSRSVPIRQSVSIRSNVSEITM
jgi:hypothetical protein